jgi:hypothetical protein
MITGYGGPPHGCLRTFGKTGQEKLTGRRRVYATSTDNANASTGPVIPPRGPVSLAMPALVAATVALLAPVPLR